MEQRLSENHYAVSVNNDRDASKEIKTQKQEVREKQKSSDRQRVSAKSSLVRTSASDIIDPLHHYME